MAMRHCLRWSKKASFKGKRGVHCKSVGGHRRPVWISATGK